MPHILGLGGRGLRPSQRLGAHDGQFLLALSQFGALADALIALRLSRGPLLLNGLQTPLQIGMKPVNALEGCLGSAPPFFQAGQFSGYLRRFLLQAFTLCAQSGKRGLQLIESSLRRGIFGL